MSDDFSKKLSNRIHPRVKPAIFSAAILALLQTSCMVGPDYVRPNPAVPTGYTNITQKPAPTTQASIISTESDPTARWWTTLSDPVLNTLIDRAVSGNLDVQQAEARVQRSRAEMRMAGANEFPKVDVAGAFARIDSGKNVSLGGSGPGSGGIASSVWTLGFDSSWEIDVFGGQRRRTEAAIDDFQAAVDDRRAAMVTLTAEVAHDYLMLRGLQLRLKIANDNLALQEDSLGITRSLRKAGFNSALDVTRAQTQVSETRAQIIPLKTELSVQEHAIATLLGEEPNALITDLETPGELHPLPAVVSIGMPADLLRRRPDIRRSERQIASANARVGAAISDFYPKFSLTGDFGLDSNKFQHLFDWGSRYFIIYPNVDWHLLDFGRTSSAVDQEKARRAEAFLAYHATVLKALREVEDALVAYRNEQDHHAELSSAVDSARESVDIARDQYKQGITDFLQVLDAQRQLLVVQDELAQSNVALSTNLVALYKAIGGGWEWESAGLRNRSTKPTKSS